MRHRQIRRVVVQLRRPLQIYQLSLVQLDRILLYYNLNLLHWPIPDQPASNAVHKYPNGPKHLACAERAVFWNDSYEKMVEIQQTCRSRDILLQIFGRRLVISGPFGNSL